MLTEPMAKARGPRLHTGLLHGLATLLRVEVFTYFRSRSAMFWTFLYPVLLLVVLMAVFGGGKQAVFSLEVAAPAEHIIVREIEDRFHMINGISLEISHVTAETPLAPGVPRIIPRGGESNQPQTVDLVIGGEISAESGATIAIIGEVVERLNRRHAGAPEVYHLNYLFPEKTANDSHSNSAAYYISGLAALTILSVALFGFTQPLVEMRASGAIKCYHLLPISRLAYLLAFSFCRFLILFVYSLAFMMIAYRVYGVEGRGWETWFNAAGLIALGIAAFLAIGLGIVASVTRTTTAAAIVNVVNLPLMFLSDLFIPVQAMPGFMQAAVRYSPINQFVTSLRTIVNNGGSLATEWSTLLMLFAVLLICLTYAAWFFKWQAE